MSCCPLCKSNVGKLRVMFVKHVTSSKESIDQYFNGTLTFENWLSDIEKSIKMEKENETV